MNLYPILDGLKIQDKDTGDIIPWRRNWAQNEYIQTFHEVWNRDKPVRIIVLKARQLGISTATSGLLFSLSFTFKDRNSMFVAHDMDSSEHMLGMSTRYWENYAFKRLYTPQYVSKKHLKWRETRSSMKVITAGNTEGGRSKTLQYLHASEVAFWDDAKTFMLGLRQTVPNAKNTFICLESTANGIGNYFHDEWNAAVDGETEFVPMFFPWWKHHEYRGSHLGLHTLLADMTEEERLLKKLGVSDDALVWRRYAIPNLAGGDLDRFRQEYPATPEEAFISTGHNVFPLGPLNRCFDKMAGHRGRLVRDPLSRNGVRFQADATGPLTIFSPPSENTDWGMYFVGGDPTKTTVGDFAVGQVINRRSMEQVAILRARCDPNTFAEELAKLGTFYNSAIVATEATGPGYATIAALIQMEYPHLWKDRQGNKTPGITATTFGWNTTHKSKEWLIGFLLKVIVDNDIRIHDSGTFRELRDYVSLESGGYGPASKDGHDDTVMAFAIACLCSATEPPLPPYGTQLAESRTFISPDDAIDPNYWSSRDED